MSARQFYLRSYPIPDGMAAHAAAVEQGGWDGLLLTDSQNLSMDVFASLGIAAAATSTLRLGTAVTNLTTRHPAVVASTFATLHHLTSGRAHLGVGRGDTALELIGVRPPSASAFELQVAALQQYLTGRDVDVEGFESRITWLPLPGESKVPVDVFGSGPRVLGVGATRGDRVTATVGAEPERVAWAVSTVRDARAAAGLNPHLLDVGAFVVVCVGTDEADMDEFVRGNAGISAHFQRNVTSALSAGDERAVEGVTRSYDFYHHGLEHASQSDVLPADFLRRFCVLGSPDECISRLSALLEIGLSHLGLVGGSRDIDEKIRERSDHLLASEVLPALRQNSATIRAVSPTRTDQQIPAAT